MRKWLLLIPPILLLLLLGGAGIAYRQLTHRVHGAFFDSNGVQVHYTDEGHGDPVILVHGFAANADLNWRQPGVTARLTPSFRVISMDLRGHGLSGKPHEANQYGIEMVNDVVRLLDHLHIQRAHVVGYSLGGFIALKLATTHPDRLITAAPLGAGWESPEQGQFLNALAQVAADLEAGRGIRPVSGQFGGNRARPGRLHTFWVWLMTKYFNDRHALIGVLKGIPGLAVTEAQMRALPMPVCSIVGDNDPLLVGAERMKGLVPRQELTIIAGADHLRAPARPELQETLVKFLLAHKAGM